MAAGGWGDPGEGLSQGDAESLRGDIGALQQEESDKLKKIKRGKTKTLDLAMRRRGSGNLPPKPPASSLPRTAGLISG